MKMTATPLRVSGFLTCLALLVMLLAAPVQAQVVTLGKDAPAMDKPVETFDPAFCFCSGPYKTLTLRYEGAASTTGSIRVIFSALPGNKSTNFGVLAPGDIITVNPPSGETTLGTSIQIRQGSTTLGTIPTDCGAAGNTELNNIYTLGSGVVFRAASFMDNDPNTNDQCFITSDPEIEISVDLGASGAPPYDPGDVLTFIVDVCNNSKDGVAAFGICDGSGTDWPFGVNADALTTNILLANRLSAPTNVSVQRIRSSGTTTCAICTTSISGQQLTVTLPFTAASGDDLGENGGGGTPSVPRLRITFDATVQDGAAGSEVVAIAEVSSVFPKDADATSGDCNLSNFLVQPPNDDDCDDTSVALTPVELTGFDALVSGPDVRLAWETASEINNAGFEVQHRYADEVGKDFETLDFVDGHGTTNEPQRYEYLVEDLPPGRHVFRLKQVDYDGAFEYSPQLEVSVEMPETYLITPVYPNPFNPEASFSFGVRKAQQVSVDLFNMLGQHVRTLYRGTPASGSTQTLFIDASGLTSGTYLLRVSGEQFVETQTITVLK